MTRTRRRWAVLLAGLTVCLGCATYGANTIISYVYYVYGPEDALEMLDTSRIAPENFALAELERAVALLELGRYEGSVKALERAEARLETDAVGPGADGGTSKHPPWRPEIHERVLVSTMAMADALALYDVDGAAAAADRAMREIAEVGCAACHFDFTRVLAALAYGGAGRFADAIAAIDGVVAGDRGEELVDGLRRRLELGVAAAQPAGLAPPPVESERFVVAILLLGRGPYKDPAKLEVGPGVTIHWCRYESRGPQAVGWAAMELEDPPISVELTEVEELAAAALEFSAQRVIAGEERPADPDHTDLRHWSSLPASMQLVVADLPPGEDFVDLVYYSPDGYEIDRETIEVPSEWWGGPIYVLRRMP